MSELERSEAAECFGVEIDEKANFTEQNMSQKKKKRTENNGPSRSVNPFVIRFSF